MVESTAPDIFPKSIIENVARLTGIIEKGSGRAKTAVTDMVAAITAILHNLAILLIFVLKLSHLQVMLIISCRYMPNNIKGAFARRFNNINKWTFIRFVKLLKTSLVTGKIDRICGIILGISQKY